MSPNRYVAGPVDRAVQLVHEYLVAVHGAEELDRVVQPLLMPAQLAVGQAAGSLRSEADPLSVLRRATVSLDR